MPPPPNLSQNFNNLQQFENSNNGMNFEVNNSFNQQFQLPDTPETENNQFQFSTNFQIPESRVTGQTLNLKYYQQKYNSHSTPEEDELTARWNNIVNTLKSTN